MTGSTEPSLPVPEPPVVAIIPTGQGPISLTATADAIWVELHRENLVARIDPATNEQVEVTDIPVHCYLASSEAGVWASIFRSALLTRFDPATGDVLDEIPVAVCGLAADGDDRLWALAPGTGELLEFQAGEPEPIRSIMVATDAFGLAVLPDAIWVAGEADGGTVYRVDRESGEVTTIGEFRGADAVAYLFDAVWSRLEAAITIQRRLADQRRAQAFAPAVRIGIHQAEANRVGLDYAGTGVNQASRIGAAAEGGEILVSALTLANARHAFGEAARRTVELKGLSAPVEVISIDWR